MKAICIIILLNISPFLYGSEEKLYSSHDERISIKLDGEWKVNTASVAGMSIMELTNTDNVSTASISVYVKNNGSPDDVTKETRSMEMVEKIQFAGMDGKAFKGTAFRGSDHIKYKYCVIAYHNHRVIKVQMVCPPEDYEKSIRLFKTALKTLKVV